MSLRVCESSRIPRSTSSTLRTGSSREARETICLATLSCASATLEPNASARAREKCALADLRLPLRRCSTPRNSWSAARVIIPCFFFHGPPKKNWGGELGDSSSCCSFRRPWACAPGAVHAWNVDQEDKSHGRRMLQSVDSGPHFEQKKVPQKKTQSPPSGCFRETFLTMVSTAVASARLATSTSPRLASSSSAQSATPRVALRSKSASMRLR